jgi:hypothetical protein
MTSPQPGAAWKIGKPDADVPAGPGNGPSWRTTYVTRAVERIEQAPTVDAAAVQALTEQVVVLHSIRRILIWTLVLVPLILTALGIILLMAGQTADPY